MFELLFKYPEQAFAKGRLVLLGDWPVWLLPVLVLAVGAGLAWHLRSRIGRLSNTRAAVIWLLESAFLALLLLLLWRPALSIATLKPQQNVVAVVVDTSRSMSISDAGGTRLDAARATLASGLLAGLEKRFQVRLYEMGKDAARATKLEALQPAGEASRIGDSLKSVLAEASALPLGAVVLLSDGADNQGGISLDTVNEIRQRRVPVHTIGFGREKFAKDLEISEVTAPARALADSRVNAQVSLRQTGFKDRKARVSVRADGKVLASEEVTLGAESAVQTVSLLFNAGIAGSGSLEFGVEPLDGEENARNNRVSRLLNVEARKPRVLYLEGEPRWEFKFIRRAIEEDRSLRLASILRTTQNKIYRQGIDSPKELEEGFPAKAEELFAYSALVIGSVEASYFTPAQQELLREFVNRRGGGILFLGGRSALADGGFATSPLAELLPVRVPASKGTFHREQASFELTSQGRDSLLCRLDEKPDKNAERWKKLPKLADYQQMGEAKPGALVLAELTQGNRRSPLLATQLYGRGRTAIFATGGSWRWKMQLEHTDRSHEQFWQQMLRWLASEAPSAVSGSTPKPLLADETEVVLRAEVRNKTYQFLPAARVEAHIVGPNNLAAVVEMRPQPLEEGVFTATWTAAEPGAYLAEIIARNGEEEAGRDVVLFRRENGIAENFRAEQNRELLEKLSQQTGGSYYTPASASKLGSEISYSEAGITTQETRDLWDMPIVFLLALAIRAAEWILRRKWGVV